MAITSPHIEQRRQDAQDCKKQVEVMLNWSELQYCEHQYNMGIAYLYYYLMGFPLEMERQIHSKVFWNWWKNKWADRDRAFVEQLNGPWRNVKLCTLVELYMELNDPLALSKEIKPDAIVLGDGYAKMLQEIKS